MAPCRLERALQHYVREAFELGEEENSDVIKMPQLADNGYRNNLATCLLFIQVLMTTGSILHAGVSHSRRKCLRPLLLHKVTNCFLPVLKLS